MDVRLSESNDAVNDAVRQAYTIKAAQNDLLTFAKYINPEFQAPSHIRKIAQKLQEIKEGTLKRLIISVPPRHGKSMLASKIFPAWYIGNNPTAQIIITSYADTLATDFTRWIRNTINDPYYQTVFPVQLREDIQAANRWETTTGGVGIAAGVGGAITGRGADLATIDDPLKNYEEAMSQTIREKIWDWYTSTLRTRLHPSGAIVVIMCMTGDTIVTMGDGSREYMRNIRVNDEIMSYDGSKFIPKKVVNYKCQGEDYIYEIRTGNNRVKANSRHPFLVYKNNKFEWTIAKNLSVGDKLVCSSMLEFYKDDIVNYDEAWLLGFMFGDGWITINNKANKDKNGEKKYKTKSYITCCAMSDKNVINKKILDHFGKIFGIKPKLTKYGYIRTEISHIGRWFLGNGLHGKAKTKRLPRWIYSQSYAIRKSFLDGFMDADGHVTKNKYKRRCITLSNEELLYDIRHLIRSIGINPSNINKYEYKCKPPNSKNDIYAINYNLQYQEKFIKSNILLNTIRNITKRTVKENVYDIQVEDTECFIADGLIVHNTRWHDEDLAGRLQKHEPGEWDILKLPAIDENNSPLWPERFDYDELMGIKRGVTSKIWEALYQQNPIDITERLFTEFKYIDEPDGMAHFAYFDPAFGGDDASAITIGGFYSNRPSLREDRRHIPGDDDIDMAVKIDEKIIIIGGFAWHGELPKTYDYVEYLCNKFNVRLLGVESNQAQIAVGLEFKRRGINVRDIGSYKNKYFRIQHYVKKNWDKIYFCKNNIDSLYMEQMEKYSEISDHDDAPDSLQGFVNMLGSILTNAQ